MPRLGGVGGSLRFGCHHPQAPLGLPVGSGARACPLPAVRGCGSTDAGVRLPGAASPGAQGSHTCPTHLPCCLDSQNQSRLASRPARGEPMVMGPFPCPGLPLCPRALAHAAAPTPAGSERPDSTLLKPTEDTVIRGRLCRDGSVPWSRVLRGPWWKAPCLGARREHLLGGRSRKRSHAVPGARASGQASVPP